MISELRIADILLFNYYDSHFNLTDKTKRENIWKDLHITHIRVSDHQKQLISYIDSNSDYHKEFIYFTGYSGNGKSTFLHEFKKQFCANSYNSFIIINFLKKGYGYQFDLIYANEVIQDHLKNVCNLVETYPPHQPHIFPVDRSR